MHCLHERGDHLGVFEAKAWVERVGVRVLYDRGFVEGLIVRVECFPGNFCGEFLG